MRLALKAAAAALLMPGLALLPGVALAETAQKGMPQLDFANPLTIGQVVWLAAIFAVMYVLLSSWALPQVGRVINDRSARIAGDLDQARSAKAAADEASRATRTALHAAQVDGQLAVNAAIEDAKRAAAGEAAALNAALEARLAESEQAIAAARTKAMAGLRGVAAEVAQTMVERLTGRAADRATIDAALGGG